MQGRQNSMSYPGQGRPRDAEGSEQDKAKPEDHAPGRSTPSAQENIHREQRIPPKGSRMKRSS
jgi:hypothetical protein